MSAMGKAQEKALKIVDKFVKQVIQTRREDMKKMKIDSIEETTGETIKGVIFRKRLVRCLRQKNILAIWIWMSGKKIK